jgi:hypothetical protein
VRVGGDPGTQRAATVINAVWVVCGYTVQAYLELIIVQVYRDDIVVAKPHDQSAWCGDRHAP